MRWGARMICHWNTLDRWIRPRRAPGRILDAAVRELRGAAVHREMHSWNPQFAGGHHFSRC